MRTVRDHSGSKRVDLYPQTRNCPDCHQPLKEKYHKQRWIVQLGGQLQVVSHCLGCENPQCSQKEAVYRPEVENLLALKGYTFGLDVIAYIGQLRYRQNQTIEAIQRQLAEQLSICVKEVALLCEVFLALVTTVAQQDPDLILLLQRLKWSRITVAAIRTVSRQEGKYPIESFWGQSVPKTPSDRRLPYRRSCQSVIPNYCKDLISDCPCCQLTKLALPYSTKLSDGFDKLPIA